MVNVNLTPTIVVPNGWTKGEGAGTLYLDAAFTKAQRDVLRGGCVLLTLCKIPLNHDHLHFHTTVYFRALSHA